MRKPWVTTESGVTTYAYWPDGLVKSITYPNGAIADTSFADSYDSAGRLTYLVNHFGTAGVVPSASQLISSFQYSYDRDGNRLTQTEIHPWLNAGQPETTTYGYDGLNRLTSVSYYNDATLTYTYDADGNRLTEKGTDPTTRNPVSLNYVYNALNELTSVTNTLDASQDVTYTYDGNGNRTTMTVGSSITPYFYNILDQLVKTTETSGGIVTFDYDYTGMRVKETDATGQTRFLYDANGNLLLEYDGTSGQTSVKYNYGNAIISQTTVSGGARSEAFYSVDALGSTSELTTMARIIQAGYQYDPWGNTLASFGGPGTSVQFTGQFSDVETGLYYYGARYYDGATGRFITQDAYTGQENTPITLNRYVYANANPLSNTDPTGEFAQILFGAAVGTVVGGVLGGVGAYLNGGNWQAIAYGAAIGGVSGLVGGAIAGLTGNPALGMAAGSAFSGFVTTTGTGLANNKSLESSLLNGAEQATVQGAAALIASPLMGIGGVVGGALTGLASSDIAQVTNVALGEQKDVDLKALGISGLTGGLGGAIPEVSLTVQPDQTVVFVSQEDPAAAGDIVPDVVPETTSPTESVESSVGGGQSPEPIETNPAEPLESSGPAESNPGEQMPAEQTGGQTAEGSGESALMNQATTQEALLPSLTDSEINQALDDATACNLYSQEPTEANIESAPELPPCFAAGTQVVVPSTHPMPLPGVESSFRKPKSIEDLADGDYVLARDEGTGTLCWKRVLQAFSRISDHLRIIIIRDADEHQIQKLKTTNEHPFWVDQCGWVKAGELQPGARVLQADGQWATVISSALLPHPQGTVVCNLKVEDYCSYFVAEQNSLAPAVWVHNAACIPAGQFPGWVGKMGEVLALQSKISEIAPDAVPLQNESGNGLDAIGHVKDKPNTIAAFETKTNEAELSFEQMNPKQYVKSRLERLAGLAGDDNYSVTPQVKAQALKLLQELSNGAKIEYYFTRVTGVGKNVNPTVTISPWTKQSPARELGTTFETNPDAGAALPVANSATTVAALDLWAQDLKVSLSIPLIVTFGGLPVGELGEAMIDSVDSNGMPTAGTIILSSDAAGVGWFIDPTPFDNSAFGTQIGPDAYEATGDSPAVSRYDLYTVLLHEIGHLLGIDPQIPGFVAHVGMLPGSAVFADGGVSATFVSQADDLDPNLYPNDLMSLDLAPGERRLPSALDVQIIDAVRSTSLAQIASGIIPDGATGTSAPTGSSAFPGASQPARQGGTDVDNIINGNFAITDPTNPQFGWTERGSVAVANNRGVLSENPNVFSELSQTFAVPADATALRFTVYSQFSPNGIGPPDAFEAALLNANTGVSVVSAPTGLTETDSYFNLQTSGQTFFSPETQVVGVSTSGDTATAGSPLVVTVSLAGVAVGTEVTLDLDLLGFGPAGSTVEIANVQFLGPEGNHAPVANPDSYTTQQGQTLQVSAANGVLANDTDQENDPLTAQLLSGPADGTLTLNADGSFVYTPNTGFSGTDSFSYQARDGQLLSQPAIVSILVNPNGNGKSDQTITFGSLANQTYGVAPITLSATASSGDPVAFSVVSGPATLVGNVLTVTGAGNVDVEASQAGDSNYNAAPVVDESFTVAAEPLSVTTQDANRAYGTANPSFAVTYMGFVSGDGPAALDGILTITTAASASSNVGQYAVTPGGLTSANYAITFQPGTLTIIPAVLTVAATGVDKVYDGTTAAVVTLSDNRISGDLLTVGYSSAFFSDINVGTAKTVTVSGITISGPDAGNYTLQNTTITTTASITPAPSTVVVSTFSPSTYGQSITFTALVTSSVSGTVPAGSVQFLIDGVDFGPTVSLVDGLASSGSLATLGAGSHVITADYLGDLDDTASSGTGTQVVDKAHLYVTASNFDIAHGDVIPTLTDTITGFIPGDSPGTVTITGSPVLATTATSTSAAGRYVITVNTTGMLAANYDFVPVNGTLTVHPKVVDVLVQYGSRSMSIEDLKRDLPFSDITAIDILFSDDVTVTGTSATLKSSTSSGTMYSLGTFGYTPANHEAIWTLPSALGIDEYLLNLDNTLAAAVDHTINILGTTSWNFAVLPGDVDGDGIVGTADLTAVHNQMPQYLALGQMPSVWADINGDGVVDVNDYNLVKKMLNKRLP